MSPSFLVSAIPFVSLLYSPCLLLMLNLDDLMEKLGGSCFNLNDNDYDHIDSGKERVFKSVKSITWFFSFGLFRYKSTRYYIVFHSKNYWNYY
jgi:hypothetical protein